MGRAAGPGSLVKPPGRGDLVWLDFDPQLGHEQAGRRPALVLSGHRYNAATGLLIACPVTSQVKGYPFEVPLPVGLGVVGVVLADQVRVLDWRARRCTLIGAAPAEVVEAVLDVLVELLEQD